MIFYIGDRVRVAPFHHSFYAMQGEVKAVNPVMVKLDGYTKVVRIEPASLSLVEASANADENLTGAE